MDNKTTTNTIDYKNEIGELRFAIQSCYSELTESIYTDDILGELYAKGSITLKEKQHVERRREMVGSISQSEKLLEYLLEKTDEQCLINFMECLHQRQVTAYALVINTADKIRSGEILIAGKTNG